MKITFLSGVFEGFLYERQGEIIRCQPSIAYYWLRSFFETTKPHLKNKVKWSRPLYYEKEIQHYVDYILDEKTDMLCSTIYTWNVDLHYDICKRVKEAYPNIKIVLGGPEIDAKNIASNFERFDIVDAVVYGDGEEAFAEMIEDYLKTGTITEGINRAISPEKLGHYKRFQYEKFPTYSFYMDYKKELLEDLKDIKEKFGATTLQVSTEYMRGCSYGCTFCDWSSGLHHKVSKRQKEIIKQELDFLHEILGDELSLYWCDPNWGLGKHYDDLTDYLIESGVPHQIGNWTKINKWQSFELWKKHILTDDFLARRNMAMQSPKQETLEAIKRPEEFTWEEQLEYLKAHDDFINELNSKKVYKVDRYIYLEFILDLPHMELEDYKKIFRDMNQFTNCRMNFYNWVYLVNAPAADPGYLEKYGLEVVEYVDFDDTMYDIKKSKNVMKNKIILNTSQRDVRMFVRLMTFIYNYDWIKEKKRSKISQYIIENHIDEMYEIAKKLAAMQEKQFKGQWCDMFKVGDQSVTTEEFFGHVYRKNILGKLIKEKDIVNMAAAS